MITIYTDGSSKGNPGPGGWGAIILGSDTVQEIGGGEKHTTNNRMELTAAIKSLEFAPELDANSDNLEVIIYTDSKYVMKGMTEWIDNWQKKGWRTAGRKSVLNQDLWQELLKVSEGKNVGWKHVAGHTGVPLNDRADEIATTFADGLVFNLYNGPRNEYK